MRRTLFALAALVLLGLPAAASADSLVFTKDHDIWLARPDGTGLYRVTTDGTDVRPYVSPSQADDGTIVAGHGAEIVRLRQNGQVLSRFDPPPAVDSTGAPIDEVPQDIAVSPDGSRIAFAYYRPSCPPAVPCGVRQVLLYSYADRATPVSVFGQQTNRRNPSWVGDNRILLFGGAGAQVNLDAPGGGNDDAVHWFDDDAMEDLDDGELSRQGDRLAVLRSYGSNLHLAVFHVGAVGGPVEPACATGADATLASPSWSPDGRALAVADADGIEVLPLPGVTAGSCPGASSSRVVVPGGAEPDWGPANVAPGPRPAPADGPAPAPCRACGPAKPLRPTSGPPEATITVRKAAQQLTNRRLATVASVACPRSATTACKVTLPTRATVTIEAKRYRLAVVAPKTIEAGHHASIRVRLTRTAFARLAGRRGTVRVKVAIAAASARTARTVTVTVIGPPPRSAADRRSSPPV